jgi:hypothetical protein
MTIACKVDLHGPAGRVTTSPSMTTQESVAGVERGEFAETDTDTAAMAVFTATTTFHHPLLRREWSEPGIDAVFQAVTNLVVDGLTRR